MGPKPVTPTLNMAFWVCKSSYGQNYDGGFRIFLLSDLRSVLGISGIAWGLSRMARIQRSECTVASEQLGPAEVRTLLWGARALMDGLASCGPSAAHRFWWAGLCPPSSPPPRGALPQPKTLRLGLDAILAR